jgi:hypothetical protein
MQAVSAREQAMRQRCRQRSAHRTSSDDLPPATGRVASADSMCVSRSIVGRDSTRAPGRRTSSARDTRATTSSPGRG